MKKLFTSESVTQGHPDKICDQISDAVLDAYLAQDENSRVACEVMASAGTVYITGEITSKASVDIEKIARETIARIGYTKEEYSFTSASAKIVVDLNQQSPDIAMGVDKSMESKNESNDPYDIIGAGDQGMVFGYATNETEEYMPIPIILAHKLARKLAEVRENGEIPYLRPDGKTQVTVDYLDGQAREIETVLISTQHDENVDLETIKKDLTEKVIAKVLDTDLYTENTKILVNPTGRFVIGGPVSDSGLTGRKIIVDTYGGFSRHGGGAFSGKDGSKVDRSASYMARFIAKNMVAAGMADKLEVGVSYAIGVAKPISIYVDSFGTGRFSDDELTEIVKENFDLRPAAIIDILGLKKAIFSKTAAYGHFGRHDVDLPWERLDKVEELKALVK